jgi:hypothetical protein
MRNKTMRNKIITTAGSITLFLLVSVLSVSGALAQDKVTPDEAQAIAKDAYLFTYPLVMNYRTMYMQALDPKSGVGLGNWLHLGMSTPDDKTIVSPNNDTPYSYAWLDLRAEPWVLTMPRIEEKRFYTSQWDDMWAFVLGNAGSVDDGNGGVKIMLASPTWDGKLPAGIDRVIQGETSILGSLTRTQTFGFDDLPNVKKIQQQYKLQPLSAYLGKAAPKAAPAVKWMPWVEGSEMKDAFWPYANFMLSFTTPNAADKKMLERIASIGVAPGADWNPGEMKAAIQAGQKDALEALKKRSGITKDVSSFFGPREQIKTDYFDRALGVYMGIFANTANISTYITIFKDADGDVLNGSKHSYTLRFEAGKFPPVKNFWSITCYTVPPASYLVANPIDRYTISSASPGLKTADDGSITLYFSVDSPGKDKESNWLPIAKVPLWLPFRLYGPGEAILNKTWTVPPFEKAD